MNPKTHLYLLWTSTDMITAEKMVFMYAENALIYGWWKKVTLIIWGGPAKLADENAAVRGMIAKAQEAGVHVSACKACADQLGVTAALEEQGIEVKYWGAPLTDILKREETLLTI